MKFILPAVIIFLNLFYLHSEGFQRSCKLKIEIFEPVDINGVEQWILIRGNNFNAPVLLYLHGGPGQSLIPFAHKATDKLLDDFIVVYWDQRGTGLSYNGSIPKASMNIDQFVDDTKKVTEYLKKNFNKKKIFLLGHSWGSTLGTLTVKKYPEDYIAYIGVGQVVNTYLQERVGVLWLKNKILASGTEDEKNSIEDMLDKNFARRDLLMKYGGSVHNLAYKEVIAMMRSSPYYAEKYNNDIYNKGAQFAKEMYNKEILKIDFFKQVPELKIPVYFFVGQFDYVTPVKPVVDYINILKAPVKEIIVFEKSAHRLDIEEAEKFQNEIIKIKEKNK